MSITNIVRNLAWIPLAVMIWPTHLLIGQCSPTCPPWNNVATLGGHGTHQPDLRRIINIYIDSSWGNPTNSMIYNGVQNAAAAWNNATSCGASTRYYLNPNQSGGAA